MKRKFITFTLCVLVLGLISVSLSTQVYSENVGSDTWAMTRGGLLYDNWPKVLGADPPKETYPAYPSKGKKKGGST